MRNGKTEGGDLTGKRGEGAIWREREREIALRVFEKAIRTNYFIFA